MEDENKRLYNMVQDLKGAVRVFCRIRPLGTTGDASTGCVDIGSESELAMYDPVKGERKVFKFDRIFGQSSTQEQIYSDMQPLIRSVLDGGLGCWLLVVAVCACLCRWAGTGRRG